MEGLHTEARSERRGVSWSRSLPFLIYVGTHVSCTILELLVVLKIIIRGLSRGTFR